MIQTVTDGSIVTKENLYDEDHWLSIHNPIWIQDTPESIGMKLPKSKRKHDMNDSTMLASASTSASTTSIEEDKDDEKSQTLTIREIGTKIGMMHPISVMDVRTQDELDGWIFSDMVDHFEDPDRKVNANINLNLSLNSKKQMLMSPRSKKRMKRTHMSRVLNQISLEFSVTPFAKLVKSPQFVRDMDWIDQVWPQHRRNASNVNTHKDAIANQLQLERTGATSARMEYKKANNTNTSDDTTSSNQDYPRVQYYLLTSTAGCYTDFHVDFGGTSVWYHILSGEKVFLLIPPSEQNMDLYERWLCRKDQSEIFFVDMKKRVKVPTATARAQTDTNVMETEVELGVQNCMRMTLKQGQTFIIPTGWIHAVYTPVDSLVIGGNFLHGLDIKGQLDVHCLETRTRVPAKFRFPHFVQLMFYAGKEYYKRLKFREMLNKGEQIQAKTHSYAYMHAMIPIHKDEVEGLGLLIHALRSWNVGPGGDADRFGSVAYVALECAKDLSSLFVGIQCVDDFLNGLEIEVNKLKNGTGIAPFGTADIGIRAGTQLQSHTVVATGSSIRPKLKLTIKRKGNPPPPKSSAETKHVTMSKQNQHEMAPVVSTKNGNSTSNSTIIIRSAPKLKLKLKNEITAINIAVTARSSGGAHSDTGISNSENIKEVDSDNDDDDNEFPDISSSLGPIEINSTREAISGLGGSILPDPVGHRRAGPRSRTTDLVSSQTKVDDDEWLPEAVVGNDNCDIEPLAVQKTKTVNKRSRGQGSTRSVAVRRPKKKSGLSSRSRLMKKFKF